MCKSGRGRDVPRDAIDTVAPAAFPVEDGEDAELGAHHNLLSSEHVTSERHSTAAEARDILPFNW